MQNKLYLTNKSNAKQWDGRDAVWGFGKRTVLGMVTEGSDWVVRMSHFYRSHKGSWKGTATLCWLCALYCELTVLKLICSYISPRPVIKKKVRKFQFWQYGTFKLNPETFVDVKSVQKFTKVKTFFLQQCHRRTTLVCKEPFCKQFLKEPFYLV